MAIESGDRLSFDLEDSGGLRVSRIRDEGRPLRGLLSEYVIDGRVDEEQVRAALRHRAAEKFTVR